MGNNRNSQGLPASTGVPHQADTPGRILVFDCPVKTRHKQQTLTLGEFIVNVYDGCGQRKAKGLVRFAIKAHLIEGLLKQRLMID
jgi:hypothetical protein